MKIDPLPTAEAAPTGYLADWAQQNPALPDQCLLYEQRYDVPRIGKLLVCSDAPTYAQLRQLLWNGVHLW